MLSVLRRNVSFLLTDNNSLKSFYRFFLETEAMEENDNIKAQKYTAMRRYRREQILKWFLEACAVLFVLARSSSYWLPIAGEFSADLLREIVSVFRSHLFVFSLFNALLVAVYALSGKIHIPNGTGSEQPDLYDEFITNSESIRRNPALNDSPVAEYSPADEKTVVLENADALPNRDDADPNPNPEQPEVTECADDEKALVVKSYERTQSVRFERKRNGEQSQRELRRSYTDVYRKLASCGGEKSKEKSSTVNQLSNEEFNRTIEDFIATQKLVQREEYKEERKTERYQALTVCQ